MQSGIVVMDVTESRRLMSFPSAHIPIRIALDFICPLTFMT
jgi:hypothetical protein